MTMKDIENQLLINSVDSNGNRIDCCCITLALLMLLLLVAIIGVSAYVIIFVILK